MNRFISTVNYYQYNHKIRFVEFCSLDEKARSIYFKKCPQSRSSRRVGIIAYCLMPNHIHFLLRQILEGGISKFMSEISDSYTRYFNLKNERIGSLFQGSFKSKEVDSDESLLQVSRYIHLNPINSTKTNPNGKLKLVDYQYSSYNSWIGASKHLKGVKLDEDGVKEWLQIAGGRGLYKNFVESMIGRNVSLEIGSLALEQSLKHLKGVLPSK